MKGACEAVMNRKKVTEQFQQQFLSLVCGSQVPRIHRVRRAFLLSYGLLRLSPESGAVMNGPSSMITFEALQVDESNH